MAILELIYLNNVVDVVKRDLNINLYEYVNIMR